MVDAVDPYELVAGSLASENLQARSTDTKWSRKHSAYGLIRASVKRGSGNADDQDASADGEKLVAT